MPCAAIVSAWLQAMCQNLKSSQRARHRLLLCSVLALSPPLQQSLVSLLLLVCACAMSAKSRQAQARKVYGDSSASKKLHSTKACAEMGHKSVAAAELDQVCCRCTSAPTGYSCAGWLGCALATGAFMARVVFLTRGAPQHLSTAGVAAARGLVIMCAVTLVLCTTHASVIDLTRATIIVCTLLTAAWWTNVHSCLSDVERFVWSFAYSECVCHLHYWVGVFIQASRT